MNTSKRPTTAPVLERSRFQNWNQRPVHSLHLCPGIRSPHFESIGQLILRLGALHHFPTEVFGHPLALYPKPDLSRRLEGVAVVGRWYTLPCRINCQTGTYGFLVGPFGRPFGQPLFGRPSKYCFSVKAHKIIVRTSGIVIVRHVDF